MPDAWSKRLGFEEITDLDLQADRLRRRSHGVIEVIAGERWRIMLRPYPKVVSLPDALVLGRYLHAQRCGDRCLLYFNQPRRSPRYLALKYLISQRDSRFATILRALGLLDQIAEIKEIDAVVADVTNRRISEAMLSRWGWEAHCPGRWHRHWIKRYHGQYAGRPGRAASMLAGVAGEAGSGCAISESSALVAP